jgi:hypothetical protein
MAARWRWARRSDQQRTAARDKGARRAVGDLVFERADIACRAQISHRPEELARKYAGTSRTRSTW